MEGKCILSDENIRLIVISDSENENNEKGLLFQHPDEIYSAPERKDAFP